MMKCPICGQAALKLENAKPGTLWIRCITDGDYTIAENVLPVLTGLPLATRHLALNVAIIDRELEALPCIDVSAISKGVIKAEEIVARRDGG